MKKTALIYFSRRAHREGQHKQWFPSRFAHGNRVIASSLDLQTKQIIRASGLPVFHYHEGNQVGGSFGERLANAYAAVFALGYDAVVAVGNDSPGLAQTDWADVASRLSQGQCVIGPSMRGGAYLIGITAESFHKPSFQSLPWQTADLYGALLHACSSTQAPCYAIAELQDINSLRDLVALTQRHALGRALASAVAQLTRIAIAAADATTYHLPTCPYLAIRLLRGPPYTLAG